MSIQQKSPELMQAQVAAYIHETSEIAGSVKAKALTSIGELAVGLLVDHSFTTTSRGSVFKDGAFTRVPTTTEHTLTATGFANYIAEQGSTNNPDIQFRHEALQKYKEFAPDIASQVPNLRECISTASVASGNDFKYITGALAEHESHIGSGDQGVAFGFIHDGKEYVAKLSREAGKSAGNVDSDLLGLISGKGMPHMQQVAAISYTDGILVTERLPGKDLDKVDPAVLGGATKVQLQDALVTMHEAFERGIRFDPKPSNFMYDPEDGFGFIDYGSQNNPEAGELADDDLMAREFGVVLLSHGHQSLQAKEDYIKSAEIRVAQLPVLRNYYNACTELRDSQGYDYSAVLPKIHAKIVELQTFIDNCAKNGWIESDLARKETERQASIAAAQELERHNREMAAKGIYIDVM